MKFSLGIAIVVVLASILGWYYWNTHYSMNTPLTQEAIVKKYCPGVAVTLYKNDQGEIGLFGVTPSAVLDMPVSWFDGSGNPLGAFHIFGDDAKNKKTMGVVNELIKKFPKVEQLTCDKSE